MSDDEKYKLRKLRIKGKLGTLTSDESNWCYQMWKKYPDEYKNVITPEELHEETKPFGAK